MVVAVTCSTARRATAYIHSAPMILCTTCQAPLADDATFCVTCGNKVVTQAGPYGAAPTDGSLAMGQVVDGKYRVERVLGEGGMGVVYLARSIHTDVEVVIKAVLPEIAHRADIRQRTLDEGKALARIDHPNVVQLKAVVLDERQLLLIMQYIEGDDLEKRIIKHAQMRQPMPVDEVLRIFKMVLAGVSAAHAEGVIHRDLKPANILIRAKDGVAKVTDFGIAKPMAEAQEGKGKTKGVIGSVHYMAPEQVRGQRDLDRRVDVYALGIVLFQMLTGRIPFDSDNTYDTMRMQIEEPLPAVSPTRPDLPAALDGILQQACAKDREHRFPNCEAFLEAIESLGTVQSPAQHAAAAPAGSTIPQGPASPSLSPGTAPTMAQPAIPQGPPYASGPQPGMPVPAQTAPSGPHYPPTGGYGPPPATHGTITGQPATYAAPAPSGRSWILPAAGGAFLLLLLGIGLAAGIGVTNNQGNDGQGPAASSEPSSKPSSAPPPVKDPLEPYAGIWASESGRRMKAVVVGDRLEFQVVDASEFGRQGYNSGEARFVLRPVPNEDGAFVVEDRIRPVPPAGYRYVGADARNTCVAVWKDAGGNPLRGQGLGDRLDIDLAKIEPTVANFVRSGRTVTSCRGLEKLEGTRIPTVLRRPSVAGP
jgi:eukaryotic-like serine/threonine-protein kinase